MTVSVVQHQGVARIDAWGTITVPITTSANSYLIAIMGSNIQTANWVTAAIRDDAGNWWQPITSSQAGALGVQGQCGISVWVCEQARAVTRVTASWSAFRDAVGMGMQVFEVTGLKNSSSYDSSNTIAITSGNATLGTSTTGADLCIAAIFQATVATTVSHVSDSWTTIPEISNFNTSGAGLDLDDSSRLNCAYLVTSGAGSVSTTWNISSATPVCGLILCLKAGSQVTTNPNPNWPQLTTSVAFGTQPNLPGQDGGYFYGTNISPYVRSMSASYGIPYDLATTSPGQGNLELYNQDGRFDSQNTASPYYPNVLDYVPMQMRAVWSGISYGVFTGYVERWPQEWDDVLANISPTQCVDAWATFGKKKMLSCMQHEVLLDSPWAYWPLDDGSRSMTAANLATGAGGNVVLYPMSPQHTTDATADFGVATKLMGDPSTGWGQTAPTPKNDAGWTLYSRVTGTTMPSTTGGMTFEMWAELPWVPQRYDEMTLFALKSSSATWSDASIISLQVNQTPATLGNTSQNLIVNTTDNTGLLTAHDVGTRPLVDGRWHHFVCSFNGSNVTIYVDGQQVFNQSITFSTAQIDTIDVGGEQDDWVSRDIGIGTYAHVAIYTGYLSATSIAQHWASGHDGFPEDSGSRINRLLTYAGWSGPRALDDGNSILGPCSTINGQYLADALNDVAAWEFGMVFPDQLGRIVFMNRSHRFNQTSKGTLGDGVGEFPYEGDLKIDYDPTFQYNDIEIQRTAADGSTGNYFLSGDPNNTNYQYFFSTIQQTLALLSDTQVQERVNFLYALLSVPIPRLETITFRPSANPALWPLVLGFNIGDRYTVKRRPLGRTQVITFDVVICLIEHDIQPGSWTTKISTMPAWTQSTTGGVGPWQLDDVSLSVLGTSTALGV